MSSKVNAFLILWIFNIISLLEKKKISRGNVLMGMCNSLSCPRLLKVRLCDSIKCKEILRIPLQVIVVLFVFFLKPPCATLWLSLLPMFDNQKRFNAYRRIIHIITLEVKWSLYAGFGVSQRNQKCNLDVFPVL